MLTLNYTYIMSIILNIIFVCHECSVRVSNELGARNPKSASFSVMVVTLISFIISVIVALVVLAIRDIISYAFTDGEEVAAAVSDLCPLLALSIVLNGIQPVLSGNIFFWLWYIIIFIPITTNKNVMHMNDWIKPLM